MLCGLKPGELVLEFGVFSGRSINHLAATVGDEHLVHGFDSFEGLPEFWRDGYAAGAFAVGELPIVARNVRLVKGWFDQTLQPFLDENSGLVALVHIDCDLYSSRSSFFIR